jgi:predicted glycosyltransferase
VSEGQDRPTFLFLGFSRFGYGHLARSRRIAGAFAELGVADAVVMSSHPDFPTGSPAPGVREIALSPSVYVPGPPGTPSTFPGGLLADLVSQLRPRGLLIDHFPFPPEKAAARFEAALARLRAEVPAALLCAGFRGVLARPCPEADQRRVLELLGRYADLFFVYLDPRETPAFFDAHPFLEAVAARTRFVGYVGPACHGGRPPAGRVLATFGAGTDAGARIRLVCEAFRLFGRAHPQHTLDVVTGSRLLEAEYQEIAGRYDGTGRIRMTRFRAGLDRALGEHELVIAMGGYNTLTELYQSSARSIILPRGATQLGETKNEQMAQALKFERYGAVDRVLDAGTTSAGALAAAMVEVLNAPRPVRRDLDVDGARRTARILEEELHRRQYGTGRAP